MPPSIPKPTGTASRPAILLVEEYDALAVAIGLALEKFAPEHTARIARTLEAAEAAADEIRPELIIVDFDPPEPRIVEVFERLRSVHAAARVLVIAAGMPPDFILQRKSGGALQFIDKPFDLAVFGAAVQALLGPWTPQSRTDARGTLGVLGLADVIPLECLAGANLVLRMQSHDKQGGEVHLFGGQITHAATAGLIGTGALQEMLGWRAPQFKIAERPVDAPRSIQGPWSAVLIEQLRYALEAEPAETAAPSIPSSAAQKNGKKILVIDDTEMLLVFVEDILATAQPDLQITTASNGVEGLRAAEAQQPDLILMDYSLPDLNGDQVCERLLQRETTSALPVVMMSGHVLEMEAAAGRLENIVATIAKPFFSAELLVLVQATLMRPRRKFLQPPLQLSEEKKRDPKAPVHESPKSKVETSASVSTRKRKPTSPVAVAPQPTMPERVPPEAATELPMLPATATSTPVAAAPPTAIQVAFAEQSSPLTEAPAILLPAAPSLPREPPPPVPARRTGRPVTPASVTAARESEVLLGLSLEVISMEFTSALKIGAIRARPSSRVVALHLRSPALRERLNGGSDFELVSVDLDAEGRVETVRLSPARQQVEPFLTGAKLQVADVFVPRSSEARVHLTPTAVAPMRMQLRARLELTGVELSPTFQLAQIILKATGESVRVSLDSNAGENAGAVFQSATVLLDRDSQIAEILLDPDP